MNVLVVGDTILDKYIFGNIERVNPEAAYSIVLDYEYSKETLGGAANVAANIRSLSKSEVYYAGYISPTISELLTKNKVKYVASTFLKDEEILTKTRYVYDNHIILRLDQNKDYKFQINSKTYDDLNLRLEWVDNKVDFDLIVISDYAKKTLNQQLINSLFEKYSNKVFMFDIKRPIETNKLPEKIIFKCNKKEWEYFSNIGFLPSNGCFIRTEGRYGYSITDRLMEEGGIFVNYPAINVGEIVDTVGCGDTFLAGMAVDYLKSGEFNPEKHAAFGNVCSAVKVKKFGTSLITEEDIKKYV